MGTIRSAPLSEDLYATVAAETVQRRQSIEVRGRARAEYQAAFRFVNSRPRNALSHSIRPAQSTRPVRDAWILELDLRRRLADDEGALTLCTEGSARFPGFLTPEEYQARHSQAAKVADALADAHEALKRGDDRRVIEICTPIVADDADHLDATVLLAFANQRLGRLPQALQLYRRLTTLQPDAPTWREWVANVEQRLGDAAVPSAKPVAKLFEELPPDAKSTAGLFRPPNRAAEAVDPGDRQRILAGTLEESAALFGCFVDRGGVERGRVSTARAEIMVADRQVRTCADLYIDVRRTWYGVARWGADARADSSY